MQNSSQHSLTGRILTLTPEVTIPLSTTAANYADQIAEDAIFKIGKVVSVDGRLIRVAVDKTKNTSHLVYKGELLKNISVGGYIKIIKGFTKIIAKVEGEYGGFNLKCNFEVSG